MNSENPIKYTVLNSGELVRIQAIGTHVDGCTVWDLPDDYKMLHPFDGFAWNDPETAMLEYIRRMVVACDTFWMLPSTRRKLIGEILDATTRLQEKRWPKDWKPAYT